VTTSRSESPIISRNARPTNSSTVRPVSTAARWLADSMTPRSFNPMTASGRSSRSRRISVWVRSNSSIVRRNRRRIRRASQIVATTAASARTAVTVTTANLTGRDFATTVVNLIFMALFVFTPWFSKIVILIEAAVLAWSVVLAAGMFFPYLRPQLYEKSPIAGKTVFGLPIMTVACFLGFIAAQLYFWTLFFDPNAAGHNPTQVVIVVGVFVLGLAFYYIMKLIKRSQGIDVTLAFKEIPIE